MPDSTQTPILLEALRGYQECEQHGLLTVWYRDRSGRVFRRCERCIDTEGETDG